MPASNPRNQAWLLTRGLALAAFAGAYFIATRRRTTPAPRLIDWERVRAIATRIARRDRGAAGFEHMSPMYADMVARSEEIIARYTGEELPLERGSVHAFDRLQWVEANVASFQKMFEPIEQINTGLLNGGGAGTRAFGEMNQFLLSGQMGLLMGYLSRRVLGQYDLAVLGKEPVQTGRLYFVQPNIEQLERRLGLDPADFRLWIALHETTHAYEFEAHPWLRDHMNGLLQRYFGTLGDDLSSLRTDAVGIVNLLRRIGSNVGKKGYAVELVMTDEQKTIFRSLQALMCLLEGYSNHVMDAVGKEILPSYEQMKDRFEDRLRRKSVGERLLSKLTGLEMKMEQYQLGERFVNEVVARIGVQGMNRVWRGPDSLPTLEEVREPRRWIERVAT